MDGEPNIPHQFPQAVAALEDAAQRARENKIAAFAVFTVSPDGNIRWGWHLGNRPQTDLIGGLACMQSAIINRAMTAIMPEPANQTPQ